LFKAGAIYIVWKVCCKHLIGKLKGYVGDKTDDLLKYVKKIIGVKEKAAESSYNSYYHPYP